MAEARGRRGAGTALVLAAGDLPPPTVTRAVVERCLQRAPFVVAADGGLLHARALGLEPQLIVGDFDSVPEHLLAAYPSHVIERHAATKDELDLELALAAAQAAGARDLSVLGAFGDRLDQSLAAVLIAARLTRRGLRIELHGGNHSAWLLSEGSSRALGAPPGTTVSVVSLVGDAVVRGTGLAYPLDDLTVPFGTGLGVSNRLAAATASITCVAGLIAIVAEYQPGST